MRKPARSPRTCSPSTEPSLAWIALGWAGPTLVIVGDDDVFVPMSWARELVDLLPQGRLVGVQGAHTLNLQVPDALVTVAESFLLEDQVEKEVAKEEELRTTA